MDGLPPPKKLRSSGDAYITPDADDLQEVINEFKQTRKWTPRLRRRYNIAALGAYVCGRTCSSIIMARAERARRIAENELQLARGPPPAPVPVPPSAAETQSVGIADTALHGTVCADSPATSAVDVEAVSVTLSVRSVAEAIAVPNISTLTETNEPCGCAAESLQGQWTSDRHQSKFDLEK